MPATPQHAAVQAEDAAVDYTAMPTVDELQVDLLRQILGIDKAPTSAVREHRLFNALGAALGLVCGLYDPADDEPYWLDAPKGALDIAEALLAHLVGLIVRAGVSDDGLTIEETVLVERVEASEDLEQYGTGLARAWLKSLSTVVASPMLRRLKAWLDVYARYNRAREDAAIRAELRAATIALVAEKPTRDLDAAMMIQAMCLTGAEALSRRGTPLTATELARLNSFSSWYFAWALDRRFWPSWVQQMDPQPASCGPDLIRRCFDAAPAAGRTAVLAFLKRTAEERAGGVA